MKKQLFIFPIRFILVLAFGFLSFTVHAQLSTVSYTAENAVIIENFDALYRMPNKILFTNDSVAAITSALGPWDLFAVTNKKVLKGWQITRIKGNTAKSGTIMLNSSTGGNGSSNFFNLGKAGAGLISDRALGALCNSGLMAAIGVVLINNTGKTLTSFNLSYKGEQWKNASMFSKITFKYATGPVSTITDISKGTFIAAPALDFSLPTFTVGSPNTPADGNDPAYSTVISQTVSNFLWLPGEALALRWDWGTVAQMAIDDVVFTASRK